MTAPLYKFYPRLDTEPRSQHDVTPAHTKAYMLSAICPVRHKPVRTLLHGARCHRRCIYASSELVEMRSCNQVGATAMAAGSKAPSDGLRELLCLCKPTISSVAWVARSQTINGAEETKMWRFWAGMLTPGAAVARIV